MTRLRMVAQAITAVITNLTTPADRRKAAHASDVKRFAALVIAREHRTNGDTP